MEGLEYLLNRLIVPRDFAGHGEEDILIGVWLEIVKRFRSE